MIYLIIFITVAVSTMCFNRREIAGQLALRPYAMYRNRQWYRVITHGFVHADWMHLLVNMIVFWSFGEAVMRIFGLQHRAGAGMEPGLRLILLYFGGMAAASLFDIIKRRNDPYFSSIGASGAVSAVVFTSIFYTPMANIYIMGVLPLPGILFGIMYIVFESYSTRRTGDRINHHAHIFGAVYGFIFPLLTGGLSQFGLFMKGLKF